MAKIYKRNSIYWIDIFEQGKRVRESLFTTDKKVAEQRLADRIKLRLAEKGGYVPSDISWESFLEKFLVYSKGEKASNTHGIDQLAIKRLLHFYPIQKLSQITPQLLETVRYKWKEEGHSLNQINRHRNALVAMMHKAEEWGYIASQKWTIVKRFKVTEARIAFFTIEELSEIIKKLKHDYRTSAYLQGRAGLRISEAIHLRWEDIDFVRNRINICAYNDWNPKTYEKRSIPIPEDLKTYLKSIPRLSNRVLTNDWTMSFFSHMIVRNLHEIGYRGSSHQFRHSYGSHLAMAGVPLATISKWMGHASVETTEKHYLHLSPQHQDLEIKKLPALV